MTRPVEGIRRVLHRASAATAVLVVLTLAGCGGSSGGGATGGGVGTVSVNPATATVAPGSTVTITGNRNDLVWGILPGEAGGSLSASAGATTVYTPGTLGGVTEVEAQVNGHSDVFARTTVNIRGANLNFGTTVSQGLNSASSSQSVSGVQSLVLTSDNGGVTTVVTIPASTAINGSVTVGAGGASVTVATSATDIWNGTSGTVRLAQHNSGFVSVQIVNVTMSKSGSADSTLNGVILAPQAL